jgi:hypothetical protein
MLFAAPLAGCSRPEPPKFDYADGFTFTLGAAIILIPSCITVARRYRSIDRTQLGEIPVIIVPVLSTSPFGHCLMPDLYVSFI